MQEKEIFDLITEYTNKGFSASDIRESAAIWLGKETLEALWSIPRKNINGFIEGCLFNLELKPPFLDLGLVKSSRGRYTQARQVAFPTRL